MKRGPSALSLKGRALQLLAQREHSRAELRRKLLPYAALCGASARGVLEASGAEDDAPSDAALPAASRRRETAGSGATAARSDIGRSLSVNPDPIARDPASTASPAPVDRSGVAAADDDGNLSAALPRLHAQPVFERSTERRGGVSPADAACVDALLDWLEARGHLSDERFVESRVHVRAPRFGMQRIRQELARHGAQLSPDDAQALKASETERARQVWTRKFGEPAADAASRARQMRFLAARGFDAEVVRRVVPAVRPGGRPAEAEAEAEADPAPETGIGAQPPASS